MPSSPDHDDSCITVKTTQGRNYSVERYYMLSEIEQHSIHPVYLNNHHSSSEVHDSNDISHGVNENENSSCSRGSKKGHDISRKNNIKFPPFVILYLLWNAHIDEKTTATTASFQKGPFREAIQKLKCLLEMKRTSTVLNQSEDPPDTPRVYVVVDMLVQPSSVAKRSNTLRSDEFQKHVSNAEELARGILLSESVGNNKQQDGDCLGDTTPYMLSAIDLAGVTVGLTDHPRAAPGLESCLDAILIGSRDRRKYSDKTGSHRDDVDLKKSCIGIVCNSIQDLIGFDEERETDAVQGVMQSRTDGVRMDCHKETDGEEERKEEALESPLSSFAHESHRYWRVHNAGLPPEPTLEEKKFDAEYGPIENNRITWILGTVIALAAYCWKAS